MKIKILFLSLVVFASLGCNKLAHDHDTEDEDDALIVRPSPEAIKAIGIETELVENRMVEFQLAYTGVVKAVASKSFTITSPVTGVITRVYAEQNDWVTKGQVLLDISSQEVAELQYNLQEKDINLDTEINQAAVEYELALASYNREKELFDKGIVALKDIQELAAKLRRTSTSLESLKKQKEALSKAGSAKINILGASSTGGSGLSRIKAPNDGIVLRRPINSGEVINQNSVLFELANLSEVFLEANVYQKDLNEIQLNERILFNSEVYPDEYSQGIISYISPTVDPVTRTVNVRASIPNANFKLKPEMFGKIYINMNAKEAIVVSRNAVQEIDENHVVYIETQDGYREVLVKIGRSNKDQVEILEGLELGNKVVTEGSFWLKSKLHSL